ncbi:hypothetical protein ACRALDRAFT_1065443 [Sodiomyces alcalophilus JCM 7366]|uniref:uncharacterized protein n=1 Tax=Sodiomyces alcalophilus JCM 7366 TaxID=591952 RepID=UPI0039B60B68
MFQDRCRTWVEVREKDIYKRFKPAVLKIHGWIQSARKAFNDDLLRAAQLSEEKRQAVQCRLLVSSLYKVNRQSTKTSKSEE